MEDAVGLDVDLRSCLDLWWDMGISKNTYDTLRGFDEKNVNEKNVNEKNE